jgi:hypothetical protein
MSKDQGSEGTDVETTPEATGGAPPGSGQRSRRRDPRFRIGLLDKLPRLEFTSWSAKTDFPVDEEWTGIVSLCSDAVLGPLEPLAPARRGG